MKLEKKSHLRLFVFLGFVVIGFFLHFCNYDNSVFALTKYEEDFFAQNNNMFYEPCVGGSGTATTLLSGNNNAEKIWNYFVQANIEGVSDRAEVIAGILGNMEVESGFDPFIISSAGYYGLWQLNKTDAVGLTKKVNEAAGGNYWHKGIGVSSGASQEATDAAIVATLDYLISMGTWKDFIKNLNIPNSKDGVSGARAYSDLFLVKVEIAYTGSASKGQPIEDSGVRGIARRTYWQASEKRRDAAEDAYNKYAGKTIVGNGVSSAGSGVSSSALTSSVHAKAWELANQTREQAKSGPTPEYKAALEAAGAPQSSDSCANTGQSCDRFVATVLKASGVDLDVPWGDTSVQAEYFASHPEIYTEVQGDPADTSIYQPGDIRIRSGHVEIYGEKDGNSYILAASHCDRWAGYQSFYVGNEEYKIYRTTGMPACSGQGTRDMSQTALDLAWSSDADSGDANYLSGSATDKYKEAASKVNVSADGIDGTDSGYFVETVARYAGIDEGFKASDEYLSGDGSSKWETIKWEESDWQEGKQLQSGDIIQCKNTSGSSQYYIVSKSGEGFTSIGASYGSKYGSVNNEPLSASDCAEQNIIRNKNANTNNSDDCDACAGQGGGIGAGELKDGGYSSVEEAENALIALYKKEADPSKTRTDRGHTNHDNCTTFSKWFVWKYTGMDPTKYRGNGNELADNFYAAFHNEYPELTKSSTPSVYSLASWNTRMPNTKSGNHTGIVVGIDQATDTILIAEAGYNSPNFTGVHSYKLSDFNGKGVYVNLNAYINAGGLK